MSDANDTTPTVGTSDLLLGRVKWFNNRAGFGFVTVLSGDKKNEDVFVHHTGINVDTEQYKYLVQGEYVSFQLKESDSSEHPYQAGSVRGVLEGPLMCETRNANRSARDEEGDAPPRRRRRVRPRGSGPRNSRDDEQGQNWVLERGSKQDDQGENA
tara:strand:+ start:79 stop:546 length:468 start_codon:yes stop_codon:yes gene_type:complete